MKNKTSKWISTGGNNLILRGKGFYISYNPVAGSSISSWASDNGSVETALVNKSAKHTYLILNGDFRKDYEKIISEGYRACKKFYESKKEEFDSSWSRR